MLITRFVVARTRDQALETHFHDLKTFATIPEARKCQAELEDYFECLYGIYEVHYKVENPVMTYCEETI